MPMIRKTITVTEEQDAWIQQETQNSGYATDSELIREALREMQLRSEHNEIIRAKLIEAEASGFVDKTPEEILKNIKDKARKDGIIQTERQAEEDLNRIWRRGVKDFGEAQADKYYHAFFIRFDELAHNPFLYPAVEELREGYRRSVCGVDSIYYQITHDGIEIMRILGQQDIDEWL